MAFGILKKKKSMISHECPSTCVIDVCSFIEYTCIYVKRSTNDSIMSVEYCTVS